MMLSTPQLATRDEQPYAAIRNCVLMSDIPVLVPPLLPRLFAWLEERGLQPAGRPLFRYRSLTGKRIEVEVGVPLAAPPTEEGEVMALCLPAGRYATVLHTGPYSGLRAAHMALESWCDHQGLRCEQREDGDGIHWGCRTETYLTDPAVEPDPVRWQTEIAFLLEGGQEANDKR